MSPIYTNRGGGFLSSLPPVTRFILVANVVLFIIDYLFKRYVSAYLSLYSFDAHFNEIQSFHSYQLISHMFMHANLGHIFFNMFGLYMFGRVLETVIGSQKYFILYFASGLGSAALQLFVYHLQGEPAVMLGASGAIMGIVAAFAVMFPNVEMMLIFLPVPIKAKYFVPIFMVLELFFGVAGFKFDNIAHFAHLGGAIFGFIIIMFWKNKIKRY
jgi:membrane associated rhomboid family serine protease